MGDLAKGSGGFGKEPSKYILTTRERIAQGRTESKELTERLDNVNEAKQEIKPQLNNAEVYLRTDVLDGSEPYLTVLTDALANGKPIYGLRASAEVEKALAYYNGVAYSYPGFTGIQLLNWQIKAAKMREDAKKPKVNEYGVEEK